jgi:TRAP-type transport system periplasmic protein
MRRTLPLLVALLCMSFAVPAQAKVTIKFATLAPENSTWWKSLKKMGDEWSRITDGEVELKIYAGGVVGNETQMVRKMNIGQLHGGQITNVGMAMYDKRPQVIQAPMLIRSNDELDHVMAAMVPEFEAALAENGIVALNWGDAGWVHLFTKTPMEKPAETKNYKIYAYEGDPEAVKVFTTFKFEPVIMTATEVLPSLQSGLINAFPSTRLGGLALQWFALAPNMLDVPWAPLVGATVITQQAWDSIPEEHRAECMKAARDIGAEMGATIRKQDEKAVPVMEKYGLTVVRVDPKTRAEWEKLGESTWAVVRGKIVPEATFDRVKALVDEYRTNHPSPQ